MTNLGFAIFLSSSGALMNLSRLLTMMSNLGRFPRSFCQQSSISWWRASGQSCQNQHNTISQANSLSGLTVPYQQRQLIEHEFYIKGTKYCLHSLSSYRMVDHDINFAKGKIKDNSNKVLAYICHYLFHENHHLYQIYNEKWNWAPTIGGGSLYPRSTARMTSWLDQFQYGLSP